jgi:hypothetical protein
MKLTYGSLFAGIAGDKGFEDEGWECLWQVEKEPFCRAVLATHFPNVERFEDVTRCGGLTASSPASRARMSPSPGKEQDSPGNVLDCFSSMSDS